MSNISLPPLSEAQRQFLHEIGALLMPWGIPSASAQLYGYLLLRSEPVTLDEIVSVLEMAKSSASTAARVLVGYGLAQRQGEKGTKRVRYSLGQTFSGYITAQARLLGNLGRVMEARAEAVGQGDVVQRLQYLGSFYGKMEASIIERIEVLTDEAYRDGEISKVYTAGN